MKFLAVAGIALASTWSAVVADTATTSTSFKKHTLTNDMIQERLRSGKFNKDLLMSKAIPYNSVVKDAVNAGKLPSDVVDSSIPRQLENQNNMYGFSVKFNTCVDLKVKDEELIQEAMQQQEENQNNNNQNNNNGQNNGENNGQNGNYNGNGYGGYNILDLMQSGDVVSQKSFVIFNMCQTDYCYYSEDNAANTYIVDISTFTVAMSQYLPKVQEQFCETCEQNEDYCMYYMYNKNRNNNGGNNGYNNYNGGNNNGGGNNNNGNNNWNWNWDNNGDSNGGNSIDCQKCYKSGCIEYQNNYNNQNQQNNRNNNLQEVYEQTSEWLNEVGECTESYGYYKGYPVYIGFTCNYDGTGIELGGFVDESCTLHPPSTNLDKNSALGDGYYYYDVVIDMLKGMSYDTIPCSLEKWDQDGNYEVEEGEWCQELYNDGGDGGDGAVQNLAYCAQQQNDNNQDNNQQNDQDYYYDLSWWEYDIDAQYAEDDMGYVCQVVRNLHNENSNWASENLGGGVYYVNQRRGSITANKQHRKYEMDLEYIIGGIALALLVFCCVYQCGWWCARRRKSEPLIHGHKVPRQRSSGEGGVDPFTGYAI